MAVGRVVEQDRGRWLVQLESGQERARIVSSTFPGPYPVTGDWVDVEPGPMRDDPLSIVGVRPRTSAISRGAAGSGATEQVLAANIDTVWIVHGLDTPPNLRRLERYLAVAWESGAVPELVLTKADLTPDAETAVAEVESVAVGVTVHVVSVEQPTSIERLRMGLAPGSTTALLGPSGAGKSTLVNALCETKVAETGSVRERDHKGRHTTTRRQLFEIPGGAFLLDTPGLRELRVWDLAEGLTQTFPEIDELARSCRFRDCQHDTEPDCAVLAAVESGALSADRMESYRKLRAEAAYAERKVDPVARAAAVAEFKTAMKTLKKHHPKYQRDE